MCVKKNFKQLKLVLLSTVLLSTVLMTILVGCSSDQKASDSAEGAFLSAQEFDKEERYEEALKRYSEVKNKFPYSNYATQAELAMADVYFKQESFPEAQIAYQTFKELHPKHPSSDYVTFRLGLSFYNQLPETIDRDLTVANDVIATFAQVIEYYPTSEFVKEATEKKNNAVRMLAEKEEYIANFYYKKEFFDSAMRRYEQIIRKYRGLEVEPKALSKAVICAVKTGELDKAKKYYADLEKKFPSSRELEEAKEVYSR